MYQKEKIVKKNSTYYIVVNLVLNILILLIQS